MTIPFVQPECPQRVLLIKPSSLGDLVTAMPVLRGLRRSFPQARISWLVSRSLAELIAHDRDLDETILFDRQGLANWWRSPRAGWALWALRRRLRTGRFDWVIDLQGLFRSGYFARATGAAVRAGFADAREMARGFYTHPISVRAAHTVDRNIELARALGVDARSEDFTLELSDVARQFADAFCRERTLPPGGFVAVAPATRWATKAYPVRQWRKVIRALSHDLPVVLLGAPNERDVCAAVCEGMTGVIDLSGGTGIAELTGVVAASAGVLCNDSAVMNIAPALGVPAVVMIGPTRAEHTGPYRLGQALVADVPCQGCRKRTCRHVTCMQSIEAGRVLDAARAMLARRST